LTELYRKKSLEHKDEKTSLLLCEKILIKISQNHHCYQKKTSKSTRSVKSIGTYKLLTYILKTYPQKTTSSQNKIRLKSSI